uniref:MFS domain-containing protein n=1 Tax=Caenorhabditis tropicalis TaxID=1561998 RepID=A0A1I7U2K4_9PELO
MENTTRLRKWPPKRTAFMALMIAFGSSFSFGFQLLITNPAQGAFIKFLNASKHSNNPDDNVLSHLENEWSFIVAIFFLGSATGAFLIRTVAENPAYCRGVSSLINGVLLQFSLFIGAIMAMPRVLGSEDHWWYLYLFQLLINTTVLLVLPMVHESPSYLASQEVKHHDEFKSKITASVKYYHEISELEAERIAETLIMTHQISRSQESIVSVWKTPFNRRGTLLGMMVTFAMAMSGITVINAFAFEILMNVGMKQDTAAISNAAICFFSFAGILVSTKIIDHFGRRPLLISTFGCLTLVNVAIISLMYAFEETQNQIVSYLLISAICLFNFLFAMGPGPLSMFITGELVPQTCRSASSVWTNAVMAIVRFLTLTFYLPVKNETSEFMAYAIFFIVPMVTPFFDNPYNQFQVVAVLVLFFLLPETKGRNVEEIREEYERKALLQN